MTLLLKNKKKIQKKYLRDVYLMLKGYMVHSEKEYKVTNQ